MYQPTQYGPQYGQLTTFSSSGVQQHRRLGADHGLTQRLGSFPSIPYWPTQYSSPASGGSPGTYSMMTTDASWAAPPPPSGYGLTQPLGRVSVPYWPTHSSPAPGGSPGTYSKMTTDASWQPPPGGPGFFPPYAAPPPPPPSGYGSAPPPGPGYGAPLSAPPLPPQGFVGMRPPISQGFDQGGKGMQGPGGFGGKGPGNSFGGQQNAFGGQQNAFGNKGGMHGGMQGNSFGGGCNKGGFSPQMGGQQSKGGISPEMPEPSPLGGGHMGKEGFPGKQGDRGRGQKGMPGQFPGQGGFPNNGSPLPSQAPAPLPNPLATPSPIASLQAHVEAPPAIAPGATVPAAPPVSALEVPSAPPAPPAPPQAPTNKMDIEEDTPELKKLSEKARGRQQFIFDGRVVYEWEQTLDKIHIYIQPPEGVTKDMLDIKIEPEHLAVGLLDSDKHFLCEETFSRVKTLDSGWMIKDGELDVQMKKEVHAEWAAAFKDDETYIVDIVEVSASDVEELTRSLHSEDSTMVPEDQAPSFQIAGVGGSVEAVDGVWTYDGIYNGKQKYKNDNGGWLVWENGNDWGYTNLGTSEVPKWTIGVTVSSGDNHLYYSEQDTEIPPVSGWIPCSDSDTVQIDLVYSDDQEYLKCYKVKEVVDEGRSAKDAKADELMQRLLGALQDDGDLPNSNWHRNLLSELVLFRRGSIVMLVRGRQTTHDALRRVLRRVIGQLVPTIATVTTENSQAGTSSLKLQDVSGINPGMFLTISGGRISETMVIKAMDGNSCTLDGPLQHAYTQGASMEVKALHLEEVNQEVFLGLRTPTRRLKVEPMSSPSSVSAPGMSVTTASSKQSTSNRSGGLEVKKPTYDWGVVESARDVAMRSPEEIMGKSGQVRKKNQGSGSGNRQPWKTPRTVDSKADNALEAIDLQPLDLFGAAEAEREVRMDEATMEADVESFALAEESESDKAKEEKEEEDSDAATTPGSTTPAGAAEAEREVRVEEATREADVKSAKVALAEKSKAFDKAKDEKEEMNSTNSAEKKLQGKTKLEEVEEEAFVKDEPSSSTSDAHQAPSKADLIELHGADERVPSGQKPAFKALLAALIEQAEHEESWLSTKEISKKASQFKLISYDQVARECYRAIEEALGKRSSLPVGPRKKGGAQRTMLGR